MNTIRRRTATLLGCVLLALSIGSCVTMTTVVTVKSPGGADVCVEEGETGGCKVRCSEDDCRLPGNPLNCCKKTCAKYL